MASASHAAPTRLIRLRESLSRRERAAIAGMAGFVGLLHLAGWGGLAWITANEDLQAVSNGAFGLGLGLAAYTLGLRHAFDPDHISAIDNTTRKLMHGGARPLSAGFWFSLGHSTVVFGLCGLVAGVTAWADQPHMHLQVRSIHEVLPDILLHGALRYASSTLPCHSRSITRRTPGIGPGRKS